VGRSVSAQRLDSLTSLRFFAAVSVIAVHTMPVIVNTRGLNAAFAAGGVGVDFFFVLSGFVLAWSYDQRRTRRAFYWNRFARIWPLHALTWACAVLILFHYRASVPMLPTVMALVLFQSWVNNTAYYEAANAVSWSLSCEMLFYACFPFLVRPIT
jgi:peptidoglycan/LPS O-acetylase OafA/YrhL